MEPYDSDQFDPPAPVAYVTVKSAGIEIANVPMLIDTGADVSLLPRSHVESLVLPNAAQFELAAFDGSKSLAPSLSAEMVFVGKNFRGEFLVIDGWHGVLGRNVLNNLSLLLDGPTLSWLQQPRNRK